MHHLGQNESCAEFARRIPRSSPNKAAFAIHWLQQSRHDSTAPSPPEPQSPCNTPGEESSPHTSSASGRYRKERRVRHEQSGLRTVPPPSESRQLASASIPGGGLSPDRKT